MLNQCSIEEEINHGMFVYSEVHMYIPVGEELRRREEMDEASFNCHEKAWFLSD